jgi:dTDP-4-dehydrorhamnose 3,5-epimerase
MEWKMKLLPTAIEGVTIVETKLLSDHRGAFSRLFCERELASAIGERKPVQINRSLTVARGTVRGMHYQHPPYAEMKLVSCIKGRVWDVAVDLRADSPTLLQWHAEELSPQNARMLIVPEGCAHGFQALHSDSELLYLHTDYYTPEAEGGVLYNDPRLTISWPLPATNLSDRDQKYPLISDGFCGIKV